MRGGKIYNQGHEVIGWAAQKICHCVTLAGIQGELAEAKGEYA